MSLSKQGFILTRQSFDVNSSPVIVLWVSTADGPCKLVIENEQPVFFAVRDSLPEIKSLLKENRISFQSQLLSLQTFQLKKVAGLYFETQKDFYDARVLLQESGIEVFESNIRLAERFLMERFVYGGIEFIGQAVNKNGYIEYRNAKVKPCQHVPELRVVSLDIECAANGELFSIGLYGVEGQFEYKKVLMIGQQPEQEKPAFKYITWIANEYQLLQALESEIQSYDPDILIGWSVVNFDFRVLCRRADFHNLSLKLGRGLSIARWRDNPNERNQGFVTIDGRVVVDGIAALKAEAYNFPSFSLENMAQHFLGEGKATEDVDNRLQTIIHDFHHNKTKLANYNIQDCILVWKIFERAELLDFLVFRSQLTGLELDRAGGSVAAFVNLYLPRLHRHGYISPNLPEGGGLASPGGYVMDSKPGLYQHVLVLDFKSLYPSIIRTFKIDPLGLIEGLKHPKQAIEGYREALFDRDKHILPDIITGLWRQRDRAKKDKDQARSQAIKILMNSFYGVLGSGGCPFYDTRLASSITLRGHDIMQQTAKWIESYGLQVIYGDTDSTFVLLPESVDREEAKSIGNDLAKTINLQWQRLLLEEYQLQSHLEIEFESHFSRFLMPTIRGAETGSKKRYAGLITDGEKERLVFKGLENVRTDWTELAKNFQQKLYQLLFHDQDPSEFILQTVNNTLAGKCDDDLVYRKRLRRRLDSYVKNIPPHVKAARLADSENQKRNLPQKYQYKGWIKYVMTLQGPQPLEYVSARIDYQHYIDKQIQPVADAILPFVGLSFENIVEQQLGLF